MRTLRTQVKWIMISVIVVFVLTTFWGYGSYSSRSQKGRSAGQDYAVAEVDGRTVMRSQLDQGVLDLAERSSTKDIKEADVVALRRSVLDNVAIASQLEKELRRSHIEVSDEEVTNAVKDVEDRFPTKESYQEYLEQSGVTEKQIRAQLREDLSRRKLLENVTVGVAISGDEDVKTYNVLKPLIFTRRPYVEVQIAAFLSPDRAEAALARMRGGEPWDGVLKDLSGDLRERTSGDNTAAFSEGEVPPQIWAAVASADDGAFVGPVSLESRDHYVLRKVSYSPGGALPFDEVSADVREMVLGQKRRALQEEFLKMLRDRAEVKILDEELFTAPVVSEDLSGDRKGSADQAPSSPDAPAPKVEEPQASPDAPAPKGEEPHASYDASAPKGEESQASPDASAPKGEEPQALPDVPAPKGEEPHASPDAPPSEAPTPEESSGQ